MPMAHYVQKIVRLGQGVCPAHVASRTFEDGKCIARTLTAKKVWRIERRGHDQLHKGGKKH